MRVPGEAGISSFSGRRELLAAGVDVGSVSTKAVILDGREIIGRAIIATGAQPPEAARRALDGALAEAGTAAGSVERTVTTGYGRRVATMGDRAVTEITAAARGVRLVCRSGVGTIIDLGGQDTKVISLDDAGRVTTFLMNDKCAAGTGKFLEVMAHVLGVEVGELGPLALSAAGPVEISATCTVFAESEVISLIHQGAAREEIAAGLHAAIAGRIAGMVRQTGGRRWIAFIGGGARNEGMHCALEAALHAEVFVPAEPQFIVAAGAASLPYGSL